MPQITRFDAADYVDTKERQVAYIAAALESGDADFVRDALGLVARARGMGEIARKAGLNREGLYEALGETGNPEFHSHAYYSRPGSNPFSALRGERESVWEHTAPRRAVVQNRWSSQHCRLDRAANGSSEESDADSLPPCPLDRVFGSAPAVGRHQGKHLIGPVDDELVAAMVTPGHLPLASHARRSGWKT